MAFPGNGKHHSRPVLYRVEKPVTHTAACLAWIAWTLSLALTALGLLLLVLNLSHPNVYMFDQWVANMVIALANSTVGAAIASRRPGNPIAWIFCAIGLLCGVRLFSAEYVTYALLVAPGSLPGGVALAWISSWIWVLSNGLFVFLGLLFPDGRLPTSRWRWIAWLSAGVVLVGTISVAFSAGPIRGLGSLQNSLGIVGAKGVAVLVAVLLTALLIVAATSLFLRLRRASGLERQQLK